MTQLKIYNRKKIRNRTFFKEDKEGMKITSSISVNNENEALKTAICDLKIEIRKIR